mmetsp:Transcript_58001/g.117921  ORF Transcript_58001/g.117921 Transcript_58001/m.117921 type:complete len:237 (+) Transcript_58001:626-1336(+)
MFDVPESDLRRLGIGVGKEHREEGLLQHCARCQPLHHAEAIALGHARERQPKHTIKGKGSEGLTALVRGGDEGASGASGADTDGVFQAAAGDVPRAEGNRDLVRLHVGCNIRSVAIQILGRGRLLLHEAVVHFACLARAIFSRDDQVPAASVENHGELLGRGADLQGPKIGHLMECLSTLLRPHETFLERHGHSTRRSLSCAGGRKRKRKREQHQGCARVGVRGSHRYQATSGGNG